VEVRLRQKSSAMGGQRPLPICVAVDESGHLLPDATTPPRCTYFGAAAGSLKDRGLSSSMRGAAPRRRGTPDGRSGVVTGFGP
jgi:hypothetical protein